MNKTLFLDLETTGFSRDWDYIIEVAGILYDEDSGVILDEFHEYIKPGRKIPAKITELTGINDFKVMNCRSEREVMEDFSEWVTISHPDRIVGHNCKAFDLQFIRKKCDKYCIGWNESEVYDTLGAARSLVKAGKIIVPNCRQETLADYFGIRYSAHSALEDVKALVEIYKKIQKLSEPTMEDLGF